MTTMRAFCKANGIWCDALAVDRNPYMSDDDDSACMDHWLIVLRGPGGDMVVHYSAGIGNRKRKTRGDGSRVAVPPMAGDVLGCLASDARSDGETFEDWADGLGFSTDSIAARETYEAVTRQTSDLRRMLKTVDRFDALMTAADGW